MEKKGFTLVELLAVIVILAVIALIATPMILGVIDNTKKGASKDSAYGLMESADIYFSTNALENEAQTEEFIFEDGKQVGEKQLSYKGRIEKGSMKLYGDGKTALCITDGKYIAVKNINDDEVKVTTGRCSYNSETDEYETIELCQDLQEELDELKEELNVLKSKGDAQAEDIKEGKTAVIQGELITGTNHSQSAVVFEITLDTGNYTSSGPAKGSIVEYYPEYANITIDNIVIQPMPDFYSNASNSLTQSQLIYDYNPETGEISVASSNKNYYYFKTGKVPCKVAIVK